jgi:hypothetical protein
LFDVVAIGDAIAAQDVAVVPEALDDGGGVVVGHGCRGMNGGEYGFDVDVRFMRRHSCPYRAMAAWA